MLKKFLIKNFPIILVILFTIPAFFSIVRPGFFPMQDDIQAFRVHQMDKCFQDWQIPCRWVPDAGFGYGYPLFQYYPPSTYYLGEIFHLLGFQFIDSVKILFILGFILSALAMFLLLRVIFGEFPALVGSILYTYSPYKAVDVYVRGALSEFWSFVFFPLIFWSSYRLIQTNSRKYLFWFSISLGLLLLTHNLMSIIFIPILGVWCLSWILIRKKFNRITYLIVGGLLGIGMAAFFSLPVLMERSFAHLETLVGGYFDYRQHFVDLYQLFVSNHFGYGSSYLGPGDDLALSTGVVQWIVALLGVILAVKNFAKTKNLSIVILSLFFVELMVLFLNHQKSSFIWDKIAFLSWLQFPWRILADSVFLLTILDAVAIYYLSFNKKLVYIFGGAIILIAVLLNISFFQPKEWLNISDQDKFSGKSWDKQLTISIFDYLPISAKYPPITKAPDLPEVLKGNVKFLEYRKGSNFQIGKVEVSGDSRIRLPIFDYPNMKVYVDNKETDFTSEDCSGEEFCLGLITFDLNPGIHIIKAVLTNTLIRTIGNTLSLISIFVLIGLALKVYIYEKIK